MTNSVTTRWWTQLLGVYMLAVTVTAQEGEQIEQLLRDCGRTIRSNPRDGQRQCREAIAQVQLAFFPEEYVEQKREAFFLLAESYFAEGRIADSAAHLDSVEALALGDDDLTEDTMSYRGEIDRLFRPLRITIRDRRIPLLTYIDGMEIDFVYPRRLETPQINRIEILKDKTLRREDELQFVAFDNEGQAYMEINHFPIITFGGRSLGYSLIVEGKRRYRFKFSEPDTGAVQIFWEDDADWELVERVPDGMVKVVLPEKYIFDVETEGRTQIVAQGDVQHVYVPAAAQTVMTLTQSKERGWERVYSAALYAIIVITGGSALLGAR
jgi:hypothetical protein